MQVDINISQKDYVAFSKFVFSGGGKASRNPLRHWKSILAWLVLILIVALVVKVYPHMFPIPPLPAFAMSAFALIIFVILFWLFLQRSMKRAYPVVDGIIIGRHRVSIEEDGLVTRSDRFQSKIAWSAILELNETKGLLLVMLDRCVAQIIPKRDFATPEAYESFKRALEDKIGPAE